MPWPQKGPGVNLPLGNSAPVKFQPNALWLLRSSNGNLTSGHPVGDLDGYLRNSEYHVGFDPNGGLYADLSSATSATINSLREAFQLQRMQERDARGGSRYVELIRSHFGIENAGGDARFQRPEYLGGSSARIHINPVQQTSSTDATSPQGHLAAFGVVGSSGNGFVKSFTGHGIVLGLVNVRADLTYQNGVNRMFTRYLS